MSDVIDDEFETETVNYQVLHVVNGVLTTKCSFWASNDHDAWRLAGDQVKAGNVLCRVVEKP